ncbi:hypothetical protein [Salinibacter ruber]|uniref:Transferase (TIGR04331 family) n=1 Tax=Salinibacter ruber TaxID=146919 RepID=A0A9X2UB49_9BACT|nr:hypothetical protein [Salinibacter ruber]MCS3953311.1 putative transferase (TIGR04331 family) [Salinibacter ruber]
MESLALTEVDEKWLKEKNDVPVTSLRIGKNKGTGIKNTIKVRYDKKRAIKVSKEVYNKIIEEVSKTMNNIHDVSRSVRYWKIILQFDLAYVISYLVDRYLILKRIEKSNRNVKISAMDEESYEISSGWKKLEEKVTTSDRLNLQFFSQVVEETRLYKERKKVVDDEAKSIQNISKKTRKWLKSLKSRIKDEIKVNNSEIKAPVSVCDYGLPYGETKKLGKKMGKKVYYFPEYKMEVPNVKWKLRSHFESSTELSGLCKMVYKSLKWNLPKLCIEQYERAKNYVYKSVGDWPKVILQKQPQSSPVSRVYIAESVKRGAKLATVQHGCSYGELKCSMSEFSEKTMSDIFVTWGYSYEKKDVPLSPPNLSNINLKDTNKKNIGVWVSKDYRFFRENDYPMRSELMLNARTPKKHLKKCKKFAENINSKSKDFLQFRPKPRYENERNGTKKIESKIPKISEIGFSNLEESFSEIISKVELVIIDHFPSTCFLECIAAGVPTVVFGVPPTSRFRHEARAYVKELKKSGILVSDPIEAAETVNQLSLTESNITKWFHDEHKQNAINEYENMYANNSSNYLNEWAEFLDRTSKH